MSSGIVEVISLLFGLSGFGLAPNPKPPTADQALRYAMPDADVVIHVDTASIVPNNFRALTQLADQPAVKASPDLAKAVRQVVTEIEGPRGMAKATTGIDFVTDIADATGCFQIVPGHDPRFVIAVHGKFSAQTIEKIAGVAGKKAVHVGAAEWLDTGDDKAVGVTKDGVLLAGTVALVADRMADAWKAPAHGKDTNLGYAADAIAGKPVLAFVFTLSQAARDDLVRQIGGQNLATDLVKRPKMATFALFHDGIGWSWIDTTKAGLEAMAELSDGTIDLLRAAQVAPRGVAKIVIGSLESYKGTDKRVDELIAHKADLMKLVDLYVGDGTFKTKVNKDPAALRLSVRATGKSLTDVLPLGVIVPIGVLGALVGRDAVATQPAAIAAPPMPTPKPLQPGKPVQGTAKKP